MKNLALSCVVVVCLLSIIVSCERLALQEELTAITEIPTPGYPNIQATINASLDEALAVVSNAAARRAVPDPGYTTLSRVLRRARDSNLATARVLNLDPESLSDLTEEEIQELKELGEKDPDLKAGLVAVVDKLEAKYDAIPTIEVKVRPLDQEGNPAGDSYTIASEDGFLNLGYSILTVEEFLLLVQANRYRPGRGFAIDDEWSHSDWGSGQLWPSDTVRYFFDTDSTSGSERAWMRSAMGRMENGTGMSFEEARGPEWWLELWHTLSLSNDLSILTKELGDPGQATVGRHGRSRLVMDPDYVTNEKYFNHEMGHVFGLLHEHQRYDRDHYVRVGRSGSNYDKIPRRARIWFLFWSWYVDNSTTFSTPYDYHSIMHYRKRSGITLRSDGREWDVHEDEVGNVSINSV